MAGDEQVRAQVTGPREAVELTAAESWRLLAELASDQQPGQRGQDRPVGPR